MMPYHRHLSLPMCNAAPVHHRHHPTRHAPGPLSPTRHTPATLSPTQHAPATLSSTPACHPRTPFYPCLSLQLLPPVVWSCRCLLLLALSGGGNQLTCPANAPALDSTSLYILWLYQVNCMDAQTNIT